MKNLGYELENKDLKFTNICRRYSSEIESLKNKIQQLEIENKALRPPNEPKSDIRVGPIKVAHEKLGA